ncbi:MAG: Asp-tRNA(Asn)/Glu-tRNA(Gln) amidotransferase subunit GatC [Candidatus Marsarchaeota archaeon]|nr:Asp-tRNA(Asn)/Glu-tRNA(Gln) amidotransferase subunit GatC [Candidatus Marsarchaeota archaeon]
MVYMDDKEFSRLLSICRIHLRESERAAIKRDVDEVLEYFNSLESVDTNGVIEAYHPVAVGEKLREDAPSEFPDIGIILKNAKTYRFYVVGPNI